MAAAINKLPRGFRFRPTDEELISVLDSKTKQNQLCPYYPIVERSLFSENPPWLVLNDADPWEHTFSDKYAKKTIFVFSELVGLGKTRAVRKTACGTWHESSKTTKIKNGDGFVIGQMKYYTFNAATTDNSKWMMHEYSFPNYKSGYVLCKITVVDDMTIESDDGLLGKRKSSTNLDDGCSRKVCKGSGSGQETSIAELVPVYDFTCDPLAGDNNDRMREVPGYARGMQGQQIEYNNGLENSALATSNDYSLSSGSWSGQETFMAELEPVYDFTCDPLAGDNNDRMREVSGHARGMEGQQIEYNNGLENSAFVTSYDCSLSTMLITQQTESQQVQVQENMDCGTYDDIMKESNSAASVCYDMSPTWDFFSIDQLLGSGEQLMVLDEGSNKGCEGSESENEQVTVTTQSNETGVDIINLDWYESSNFGDEKDSEEPLLPGNFDSEDFDFGTSNDHVAAFKLIDSCPSVQQSEIQQV